MTAIIDGTGSLGAGFGPLLVGLITRYRVSVQCCTSYRELEITAGHRSFSRHFTIVFVCHWASIALRDRPTKT